MPAAPPAQPAIEDYFESEMRGYRLLKASRLSTSEKQHVLTQTGNSTQFWKIRLALRTLFADDEAPQQGSEKNRIWWNDDQDAWDGS